MLAVFFFRLCIPVHFADGSKTLVYVSVSETISSVIEKVRDKLTSSASQIWIVNNEGKGRLVMYTTP